MEPLITPDEAAVILRTTVRKLHGYVRAGKVGCVQIGRQRLFTSAQLDAFVQAQTRQVQPKVLDEAATVRVSSPQKFLHSKRTKKGGEAQAGNSARALREEMRSW